MTLNNNFSIDFLRKELQEVKDLGYNFFTLQQYVDAGCPKDKSFIFRLDLDFKPLMLKPFVSLSKEFDIPFTVFVRVAGPYNIFWHPNIRCLAEAYDAGCEIGLHTTPVEWANIHKRQIKDVFSGELKALRSLFPVSGIAPHRDINYMYNSLPWLNENWKDLSLEFSLSYHSYEDRILNDVVYVNEGLSPHLCWRNITPSEAAKTGKPICMLLHPHWWYVEHAFETD